MFIVDFFAGGREKKKGISPCRFSEMPWFWDRRRVGAGAGVRGGGSGGGGGEVVSVGGGGEVVGVGGVARSWARVARSLARERLRFEGAAKI